MAVRVPSYRSNLQVSVVANAYFTNRYPGYRLVSYQCNEQTKSLSVLVLEPLLDGVVCPRCGAYCNRWKDKDRKLLINDWDIAAGGCIKVVVPSRRLRCRCGCTKTEDRPQWVLPGHLDWALIKDLDKAALQLAHGGQKDLTRIRRLAIDEISIHKGHKYATVVMDLDERAIIHVVEGKRQVDLQPFFDQLQELGIDKQIESVSVDMNAAYPKLIKENLPHAKIAYDRFHVMQQLNKQVLAAAKVFSIKKALMTYRNLPAKQRKLPQHKRARAVAVECVKNAEWLVITDPDLLSPARQERLRLLRENNQLFADLYAVTAKLKTVWRACSEQSALSVLNECIELCEAIADEHGFDDVRKFGRMLRRRAEGITAACVVKFGTNILEGANNTAKVIKRVAYGFRDFEYFALKLLGAFPGIHYKQQLARRGLELVWNGVRETLAFPHYS